MMVIILYASCNRGRKMRYDTEHKARTRQKVLDEAAKAIREEGPHRLGVAGVMARAGLTHGGFYAHFPSRDALLAEALERAGQDSGARLRRSIAAGEAQAGSAFRALVESYLSERHLRAADRGCPVAALASELPRQSDAVRAAGAARVEALIANVEATLPAGCPEGAAALVAGQLVGALQIARALGDNAQGKRHLASARQFLLAQFEPRAVGHH
jgi:AcrR family transcriptional regulator